MTIETIRMILITNNIVLLIALAAIVALFVFLIRAERKLARFGESWMFKPKKRKDNPRQKNNKK